MDQGFVVLFLFIIGLFHQLVYGKIKNTLTIIAGIVNSEITEACMGYTFIQKLGFTRMVPGAPNPFVRCIASVCILFLSCKSPYTPSLLLSIGWGMPNRKMAKAGKYLYSQEYFGLSIDQLLTTFPFTLNQLVNETLEHDRTKMKYEWARYLSFESYPMDSVMTPMRLAQAGFYYTGSKQEVKCFCCGKGNGEWTGNETAVDVHRRLSPNCKFIRGENTENVPIHDPAYYSETSSSNRNVNESSTEPGTTEGSQYSATRVSREDINMFDIVGFDNSVNSRNGSRSLVPMLQTQSAPVATENVRNECTSIRYPRYIDLAARTATFKKWPLKDIQDPAVLAQAGFVYTGKKDYVRCFYCGGGLRNWEQGDNPWQEHAHWYPSCGHVLNHFKGSQSESLPNPDMAHADSTSTRGTTGSRGQEIADWKLKSQKHEADNKSLREENESLKHHAICKICLDAKINMVFLPCGHAVACEECARNLRKCAVCRKIIKGSVRMYIS